MFKRLKKLIFGCGCKTKCLNFNDLAKSACQKEGGAESQNIAEIREMLSIILNLLADHAENCCEDCVIDLIRRRGKA